MGPPGWSVELGFEVQSESALAPELGPCLGKGDAMWRAAAVVDSDVLVFLDTDTSDFSGHFLTGLLGPILLEPAVGLVKGSFRRPLAVNGSRLDGEGRPRHRAGRPSFIESSFSSPGWLRPATCRGDLRSGAALFEQLSVPVGYGVEIAMLIDCLGLVGLDALAQVDLGARQNRHQGLRDLSAMAVQVMAAVERRSGGAPRPKVARFTPRPDKNGEIETWRVRCDERPPRAGRS